MSNDLPDKEYRGGRTATAVQYGNRTPKQRDEDFKLCTDFLAQGDTWAEVAHKINTMRPYTLAVNSYRKAYSMRMKKASVLLAPEVERQRLAEDLQAVMHKAMQAYNESWKDYEESQITEELKKDPAGNLTDRVEIKNVLKKLKGKPNAKFLEVFLKAQEEYRKLMLPEEKAPLVIQNILNQVEDDKPELPAAPLTNEREIFEFAESLNYSDYEEVLDNGEEE